MGLTNIQTKTELGSPSTTAIWNPNWEKVRIMQVRLQIAVLDAPAYYHRMPADIIICGCAKLSSGFLLTFTMLFVSPCDSRDFLDPWELARTPGAQENPSPIPFLIQSAT